MSETIKNQYYSCPECQAGVMRLKYIPYCLRVGDDLITVPEFPAWVCDMCGRREYDSRALQWLNILLGEGTQEANSRYSKYLWNSGERPSASS